MSAVARPGPPRALVFVLACAVSWLLYLHRYAWGVVKPAVKAEDPSISDVRLGWLDSLFMSTYAIGQVPGGLAGDLLGPRLVLTLLLALWAGSLAWLAGARGFVGLAWARGAFGLAQAGVYPNLIQVTRTWFPPALRTTVQGVVGSLAGRAGGACAPLLVATVMMGLLGLTWRASLLLLSLTGLLLAVAFWLLFRDRPAAEPAAVADRPPGTEPERGETGIRVGPNPSFTTGPLPQLPAPGRVEGPRLERSTGALFSLGALLVYALVSSFADMLYVFWLPQFLVEGKGLKPVEMGLYAGLPLWGGALGGAVGGLLNDALIRWTGSRRLGRSAVAFSGKFLAGVLIAASLLVEDGRWVMAVLLACKFFADWGLSTQWGVISDIGGPLAGTVFGAVNTSGAVGAFLAGPLMGYVKQYHGWEVLFGVVAGVYVLAAACWLFIDSSRRLVAS